MRLIRRLRKKIDALHEISGIYDEALRGPVDQLKYRRANFWSHVKLLELCAEDFPDKISARAVRLYLAILRRRLIRQHEYELSNWKDQERSTELWLTWKADYLGAAQMIDGIMELIKGD